MMYIIMFILYGMFIFVCFMFIYLYENATYKYREFYLLFIVIFELMEDQIP